MLHAGDLSQKGTFEEIQAQLDWLNTLPHTYKVVIAGNHDLLLDPDFVKCFPERIVQEEGKSRKNLRWGDVRYLNNSSVKLSLPNGRSLQIYGSPLTQQYGNWAIQYPPIRDVWTNKVPAGTNILLTHGPPYGFLDCNKAGNRYLLQEIWRSKPQLVVFGHIHAGRGKEVIKYSKIRALSVDILLANKTAIRVIVSAILALLQLCATPFLPRSSTACNFGTFVNAAMYEQSVEGNSEPFIIHL